MITLRAAFAAAVRMIDGIHRDSAHVAALAQPAAAPGLADRDILVLDIPDLPDTVSSGHETQRLRASGDNS